MASLPVLSGKEVVKSFESLGWRAVRQSSSHIIMTKEGEIATLSVPDHLGSCKRNAAKFDSCGESDHR